MGKLKEYAQDWLERGGYELGYHMGYLPDLGDFDAVLSDDIDAQTYAENRNKNNATTKED